MRKALTKTIDTKKVKRQPPRKFETLAVYKGSPVILTDQVGKPKLYFIV